MRFIILIFIIIFSFLSLSKADDIRDFEIEGLSIGDSALKYFSEKDIKNSKQKNQYPNDAYILYGLTSIMNLKNYELITISTKKNDKNYIITSISAAMRFSNLNECLTLKKNFNEDISGIFSKVENEEVKYKAQRDKSGNSIIYGTQYYFPAGDFLTANCMDWTKEMKLAKVFQVSIRTKDYGNFLLNEAYK